MGLRSGPEALARLFITLEASPECFQTLIRLLATPASHLFLKPAAVTWSLA